MTPDIARAIILGTCNCAGCDNFRDTALTRWNWCLAVDEPADPAMDARSCSAFDPRRDLESLD